MVILINTTKTTELTRNPCTHAFSF